MLCLVGVVWTQKQRPQYIWLERYLLNKMVILQVRGELQLSWRPPEVLGRPLRPGGCEEVSEVPAELVDLGES